MVLKWLALVAMLAAAGGAHAAERYTVSVIDTSEAAGFQATALSDAGHVVGNAGDFAYRWTAGTGLGKLFDPYFGEMLASAVYDINAQGTAVGWADYGAHDDSIFGTPVERLGFAWYADGESFDYVQDFSGGIFKTEILAVNDRDLFVGVGRDGLNDKGFAYPSSFGQVTPALKVGDLDPLGYGRSTGVNNLNRVVGFAQNARGGERAWLWTEEAGTVLLGGLGGSQSGRALDINEAGQVVGYVVNDDGVQSVLWQEGVFGATRIGRGVASDVNNLGEVIGSNGDGGYLWTATAGLQSLQSLIATPGWTDVEAIDINNTGQILASGFDRNGTFRTFLLDPMTATAVPEPDQWAMLLIGFLGLGLRTRARARRMVSPSAGGTSFSA